MGGAVKSVVKQAKKVVKSVSGGGGPAPVAAAAAPKAVAKAVEKTNPAEALRAGGAGIPQMMAEGFKVRDIKDSAAGGATSLLNKRNRGYREMQKKGTLG